MPERLRIFVSSTMRDLANERAEVCERLRELNFEPVYAEGLHPNGSGPWDRLRPEIESCHLFALILGETYGWIPERGPMASENKGVTELEFDIARAAGIPVLVFAKRLELGVDVESEDARRRDRFRAEVEAWEDGLFRRKFDLARELAEQVSGAVIELLIDQALSARLGARKVAAAPPEREPRPPAAPPSLPHDLVEAVRDRSAVLFLGAGASLQAGLPAAAAFVEAMTDRLRRADPDYTPSTSGTAFNAVASDFDALLGPAELHRLAQELVDPAYPVGPTRAHRIAGRLFDTVVTTNYDLLLERALDGREVEVIAAETTPEQLAAPLRLIKLHGSAARPRELVLTEGDLANLERDRPLLWAELVKTLSNRPLLSVGSSLRDPSVVRLLEACRPRMRGWAVLHDVNRTEGARLARWGLEAIHGDADAILEALERALEG